MKIREFRAAAREALRGNWGVAIAAGVIVNIFSGSGITLEESSEELPAVVGGLNVSPEVLLSIIGMSVAIIAITLILSSLVTVGYAQFNIDLIDGVRPRIATLFCAIFWSS